MLSFYAVTTFKIMGSSTNHFQLGLITATTFCQQKDKDHFRRSLEPRKGSCPGR